MGSKGVATTTLLLVLVPNLVLIICVSSSFVPSAGTYPTGLDLDVCGNLLVRISPGNTDPGQCCPIIAGLAKHIDAAACLCLSPNDLNIRGIGLLGEIPNDTLNLLLNQCGKSSAPSNFQCPYE
ncbi:uncharacterized protein LOC120016741 [Tripterygium wilfordii]|uniref:uncharacterized protein LOC120016741 n=1 Tax=Tripterygium wilfordii TaxID=458696 RepID=UPI0018F7E5A6|nr:uncharacterized protein LOC120016741 [Tripterygium wilfordii]